MVINKRTGKWFPSLGSNINFRRAPSWPVFSLQDIKVGGRVPFLVFWPELYNDYNHMRGWMPKEIIFVTRSKRKMRFTGKEKVFPCPRKRTAALEKTKKFFFLTIKTVKKGNLNWGELLIMINKEIEPLYLLPIPLILMRKK